MQRINENLAVIQMDSLNKQLEMTRNYSCLDLVNEFWRLEEDSGLQRKLFSDFAENNPNAFSCFAEILGESSSSVLRALAIQGFRQIPQSHLPDLQGENFKSFIILLFQELRSSSDLIRWNAAKVVSEIIPPIFLESRQLWGSSTPLDRTELSRSIRELQNRYLRRIEEFNYYKRGAKGDEPEYERYLDFWIYGDTSTSILFTENLASENYRPIVQDVLAKLQSYGVVLALGCQGLYNTSVEVQDAALCQAGLIYGRSEQNQRFLYDDLVWYMEHSSHSEKLRLYVAQIINQTGDWKSPIEKLQVLSKLLFGSRTLRDGGVEILSPQKSTLQQYLNDAAVLLTAFDYLKSYKFNHNEDLNTLSLDTTSNLIMVADDNLTMINKNTAIGNQSAKDLSVQLDCSTVPVHEYIQSLQTNNIAQTEDWKKQLEVTRVQLTKIQSIILHNQSVLNRVYTEVKNLNSSVYEKIRNVTGQKAILSSEGYQTLEKSHKLVELLNGMFYQVENQLQISEQSFFSSEAHTLKKRAIIAVSVAIPIALLTVISPVLKTSLINNSVPQPEWFAGVSIPNTNSSSQNTIQNTSQAWYNTGFPKPSGCGSSSSPSGEWYRVYVTYGTSNWQGIMKNHCGDIGKAQSQTKASSRGAIQVASFNNRQDAEGFAAYMQTQYGSGYVK